MQGSPPPSQWLRVAFIVLPVLLIMRFGVCYGAEGLRIESVVLESKGRISLDILFTGAMGSDHAARESQPSLEVALNRLLVQEVPLAANLHYQDGSVWRPIDAVERWQETQRGTRVTVLLELGRGNKRHRAEIMSALEHMLIELSQKAPKTIVDIITYDRDVHVFGSKVPSDWLAKLPQPAKEIPPGGAFHQALCQSAERLEAAKERRRLLFYLGEAQDEQGTGKWEHCMARLHTLDIPAYVARFSPVLWSDDPLRRRQALLQLLAGKRGAVVDVPTGLSGLPDFEVIAHGWAQIISEAYLVRYMLHIAAPEFIHDKIELRFWLGEEALPMVIALGGPTTTAWFLREIGLWVGLGILLLLLMAAAAQFLRLIWLLWRYQRRQPAKALLKEGPQPEISD